MGRGDLGSFSPFCFPLRALICLVLAAQPPPPALLHGENLEAPKCRLQMPANVEVPTLRASLPDVDQIQRAQLSERKGKECLGQVPNSGDFYFDCSRLDPN